MKFLYIIVCLFLLNPVSQSQCFPDRHNTTWHDGWVSCEQSPNPHGARDNSHWIMYNFSNSYALQKMHIWNSNDPLNLDQGIRNMVVDYSMDGTTWTELGSFEMSQAEGKSIYEGVEALNFEGAQAQYVLITALDNYGGSCYGLSEVRFETTDEKVSDETTPVRNENYCVSLKVYPNPFVDNPTIDIQSNCVAQLAYKVTDAVGKTVFRQNLPGQSGIGQELAMNDLVPGVYFLEVLNSDQSIKKKLVKMQ